MNDSFDNEAVLGRFRQWLEETRREAGAAQEEAEFPADQTAAQPVGLLQLVEEFTALRHEVKLQTKSSRGLGEKVEQTLAALQQAAELFRSVESKETNASQAAARPLVESLIELDESLGRGRAVIDTARRRLLEDLCGHVQEQLDDLLLRLPRWRRWLCRAWCRGARDVLVQRVALTYREIFDSLIEGYDLILGRLQRAMKKADLYRIECVGRQADPNLVTVVEVVDDPLRPPGLVVEQIRPGYFWKDKVIRFAEVRAVQGRTASNP
jgi:molecular chaperone GrpE